MQCSIDCKSCCVFLTSRHIRKVPHSIRTCQPAIFRSCCVGQRPFQTHTLTSRNKAGRLVCFARRDTQRLHKALQSEKSDMVHSQLIYFMFQMVTLPSCCSGTKFVKNKFAGELFIWKLVSALLQCRTLIHSCSAHSIWTTLTLRKRSGGGGRKSMRLWQNSW